MKSLYVVAGNTQSESGTMCDLLQSKLLSTAFPGCWDMDPSEVTGETKENVLKCVSGSINYLIKSPENENIIFSWGIQGQSVLNELLSRIETRECDVKVINLIEVEKIISEHKI